ncbi:hypothetical protein K9M42_02780 [Patescibacteria group bacterium]|nr:hypothetical protein [Patescibacteria group bacterium]
MKMPERTKKELDRYVQNGIPTNGFLEKVLSNDLFGAIGKADEENSEALHDICKYIYNKLPSRCWGSSEQVVSWIKYKRNEMNNK